MEREIAPRKAFNDFSRERKHEVSFSTWRNYQYPLKRFVEFCEERDIESMQEVDGYHLKQWKSMRQDSGISNVTLKNNISSLRVFLSWCRDAQLCHPDLPDLLNAPKLGDSEEVSDDVLEPDHVEGILDYLNKFEYATMKHALFTFVWHTCARMGTAQAIDVDDYAPQAQYIEIRHRPDTGTPLKNTTNAQRKVAVSDRVAEVLNDYIKHNRNPCTEESGRNPLFTTRATGRGSVGRVGKNTIRRHFYGLTRPCKVGMDCPHDRDPEDCEAAVYKKSSSKCPTSMSPHPLRRAAITYHLNQDFPKEKLAERANVSVNTLDKHYDARKEHDKMESRRGFIDNL